MSISEQQRRLTQIRDLEGEPCELIEFIVVKGNGTSMSYQMECNLCCLHIGGLKQDFAQLFGIPEERQIWHLNGILLNDDDVLLKYIAPCPDSELTIIVTCR